MDSIAGPCLCMHGTGNQETILTASHMHPQGKSGHLLDEERGGNEVHGHLRR